MEIREKEHFNEGDLISLRGKVYLANRQKSRRCVRECDMYDGSARRCTGFCYRLDEDCFVFKYVGEETCFPKNAVAYTTPFDSRYREKLRIIRQEQKGVGDGKRLD